jgi:predicted ribosome-associated RNA-binding protein Tma20
MSNSILEKKVKDIIVEEMNNYANEIINEKIIEVQREMAEKSQEIISKVTHYLLVNSFDDPVSLKTIVQIELNKIVIVGGKR